MVYNQNQALAKECFDINKFLISYATCTTCSICGFQSYTFYQASSDATTNYFSIDLPFVVNWNEEQVTTWLTIGLRNAWIEEYAGWLSVID